MWKSVASFHCVSFLFFLFYGVSAWQQQNCRFRKFQFIYFSWNIFYYSSTNKLCKSTSFQSNNPLSSERLNEWIKEKVFLLHVVCLLCVERRRRKFVLVADEWGKRAEILGPFFMIHTKRKESFIWNWCQIKISFLFLPHLQAQLAFSSPAYMNIHTTHISSCRDPFCLCCHFCYVVH